MMNSSTQSEQKTGLSQVKLKALEEFLRSEGIERPVEDLPVKKLGRTRGPLSYAQQRLWFLNQMQPDGTAYHMPTLVRLEGVLHRELLERSLNEIVRRHEVLRTGFCVQPNGEVEQVVMPEEEIKFEVMEIPGDTQEERLQNATALALREFEEPFDLKVGKPFRVCLFRLGLQEHVVLFVIHHIASDAWSQDILLSEVKRLYSAYTKGEDAHLETPPIQYLDYSLWQREWLGRGVMDKQLEYWRRQLQGMRGILELPTDRPRSANPSNKGARYEALLDSSMSAALKRLARGENVSLFMLLLAAFQVMLWRYTGETDVAVGIPIANRNRPETEKLIGMFVNTLVVRTVLSRNETFRKLVQRVRETVLGSFAHQDVPFEKLVEELRPERDPRHTPLFQVMLDVQNAHRLDRSLEGLSGVMHYLLRNESKFDLTVFLSFDEANLRCTAEYRSELFERSTIIRMCSHFQELLRSCVAEPEGGVGRLGMMSEEERREIVEGWNETGEEYGEKSVVELFEEEVERRGEGVAVEYEGRELTYGELNGRANQLARYLRGVGVDREVLVGICMERSVEMVVGLMAILKAGGAYVPMDPGYPGERLRYMREDSGVGVMLVQEQTLGAVEGWRGKRVNVDREWAEIAQESGENLRTGMEGENLAYMIYTSGSTGRPKGAMNRHGGISNRIQWMQAAYGLSEEDRVLQKTPFSFDVSVWEFFWPLMAGARLVMAKPGGHQDSAYLVEMIKGRGITTMHFVPSMLRAFVEEGGLEGCGSLRRVMCSGEALGWELQERFFERVKGVELHNLYGPTEAAVDVTYWRCESGGGSRRVPLGHPIGNLQIYILDGELEPVPEGISGEIYIGGAGLGRGYWRRAGLTAERFVPSPFGKGERIYKTGDVGRYVSGGVIEYVGRSDHQVKIRGNRIELGEIESVLAQCARVREAVVVVRTEPSGEQRLVGYVVRDDSAEASRRATGEWKDALRKKLPEYMVPAVLVELDRMPVTENGKIDRDALPQPEWLLTGEEALPRNEFDLRMKAIWEEVLCVPFVGRTASFFDLGGHSLLALKLIMRIEREFGCRVPLSVLFANPTVEHLSDFVRRNEPIVPQSCLLPLQLQGSKRALFFVHPIGGNGLCFMQLVRLLGPGRPFFAFQVLDDLDDADHNNEEFSSIEGRARNYIQALRMVQPEGPYCLGGWSFGGYVAYEMARQLVQQGKEVQVLMLLDITTKIGRDAETADDLGIALRLANELRELDQQPLLVLPEDEHISAEQHLQYIIDEMIRSKLLDPQTDMRRLRNYLRGFRRRRRALQIYQPGSYAGNITLIRTDDVIGEEINSPTDETRGWGALTPNKVQVHFVPGRHNNMVFMPHVVELAEIVKKCMQTV
jgi:amino acid adenylation domain-containing protein